MILQTFGEMGASVLCRTGKELVAEISPAMLTKLRRDGHYRGFVLSQLLGLCGFMYVYLDLEAFRLGNGSDPREKLLIWLAASIFLIIVLPLYEARRSVWKEVSYRREHGKWRWES